MKTSYSIPSLKRWSCKNKQIPSLDAIKSIHVYDFDNTLFTSPLPNPQLWVAPTIGKLQAYEATAFGGWWHDVGVLEATGQGLEKEEPRAWEGWWNEAVVDLVRCSMEAKDVLTVALTGRSESYFAELINRMLNAKKLDFDLVVLKPDVGPSGQSFESTMSFKQAFLHHLVFTYVNADEIRVYEDRPKHVKGFRDYFEKMNKSFLSHPVDQPAPPRKPITAEVIHVCELKGTLDPQAEVDVVQRAIVKHNQTIMTGGPNPHKAPNKRLKIIENFLYFAYLISQIDSARLISLCNVPPHLIDSGEVRFMASSILIAPFYPRKDLLNKVGGRGKKVTWQVSGIAKFEDRIWAVRVAPVTETQVHTTDPHPCVVLAIRKGSRPIDAARIQNWQPVASEKAFMFETTVGDKVMLRLEDEDVPSNNGFEKGRQRGNNEGAYKRKYGDVGGDLRNRENWPKPGGDRDDGSWVATSKENQNQNQRQGGGGDRRGQGRYFNQSKANFNNKSNSTMGGNPKRNQQNGNAGGGPGGQNRNRNANGPAAAAGQRNRGGNRGPAGYKSLDDYGPGPGGFGGDGAADANDGGTGGGEMGLNY
jgi:HAD domain family 1 in Swiss Army Knife RNA repair proteins